MIRLVTVSVLLSLAAPAFAQTAQADRNATDGTAPVQRIRDALRERRPCRETLVNYHKDGTLYRVSVAIAPILDDEQQPLWFVAKERKL